jgi:pimeloyl-ACP methyl ester carboxylesterase
MQTSGSTRRDFLKRASAGTAAGVVGVLATNVGSPALAAGERGQPTFVFVPGSNAHAATPPELGLLGHRTLAVEMPGHGPGDGQFSVAYQAPQNLHALATTRSPMAGITLDDYVARAVDVVRHVADFGPVILVGGSLGGATISRVGNAVPDLVERIVYDTAFCCVELPSIEQYFATPEAETSLLPGLAVGAIGNPAEIGASRINWRSADPVFLANSKACFMADGTDAELLWALNELDPDETTTVSTADSRVDPATWGRIRHTFIRHTLDQTIPIALQDRMIREADALTPQNRFDVRTVETSHVPTGSKAREIVKILASLADGLVGS